MENKQRELEIELDMCYMRTRRADKNYNKWLWIKIFNKRNYNQLVKVIEEQNKIFRELREVTRKNHPELFIGGEKK